MRVLKYSRQYPTRKNGFTLIEILIAILISSVVLGVLYTSFFQIINARDKVEYELEMLHESRVIFNRLRKDLANAFPRGNVGLAAQSAGYQYFYSTVIGVNNELTFTSLAKDPSPDTNESDQVQVSYYMVEIQDSDLYALVRSENPWLGNEDGGIAYPISERVIAFQLNFITEAYLNAQNPEPIREWDSVALGAYPKAVEVAVTLRNDEGNNVTFNSMIFIPVSG